MDWARDRVRKEVHQKEKPNKILEKTERNKQELDEIKKDIQSLKLTLQILKNSDKDAIKSFIVKQHHYFCYKLGYIDDYSMDAIEKRYAHYKEYIGNSFVHDLMTELRNLPKKQQLNREDYQQPERR